MKIILSTDIRKKIAMKLYYNEELFISDAKRYVSAIKEGRVICSIGSVSKSGMSRTVKFLECARQSKKKRYNYLTFWALFSVLGFTPDAKLGSGYFRVNGCGMDMVFHTNYTIIHRLHRMGFINKKTCDSLAQVSITVI